MTQSLRMALTGTGLSGLVASLSLARLSVPVAVTLYEKATSDPRFDYGITLHPQSVTYLRDLLDKDDKTFRKELAVDSGRGGTGKVSKDVGKEEGDFVCHRGQLENVLREKVENVRWGNKVTSIEPANKKRKVAVSFQQGPQADLDVLVASDGLFSLTRKQLTPQSELNKLPYATIRGTRKLSKKEFESMLGEAMAESCKIRYSHPREGKDPLIFEIQINSIREDSGDVLLTLIYSRKATDPSGKTDPLHKPERAESDASEIPEEFFSEIEAVEGQLPAPWSDIFKAELLKKDRLLHWLMRDVLVARDEATRLARDGILLVGDAMHAMPILGGEGANVAIEDGVKVAEFLAEHKDGKGLEGFVEEMFDGWEREFETARKEIERMHSAGEGTREMAGRGKKRAHDEGN